MLVAIAVTIVAALWAVRLLRSIPAAKAKIDGIEALALRLAPRCWSRGVAIRPVPAHAVIDARDGRRRA